MGGIPTDEFGQVQKNPQDLITGLFAVGECAAASFHGFNRLGTNSILELITMGKFIGEKVASFIGNDSVELPADAGELTFVQFHKFLEAKNKESLVQIREDIQALMTKKVGVFRVEEALISAVDELKELKVRADKASLSTKSLTMNQELIQRWEIENLLANAIVIAQAALRRRESRGGHFRDDFPERKDEFNHHTLAYMPKFGEVDFGKRPVDMTLYNARNSSYEKFGIIERKY
jgi:succinate dehydrogenase / fumarate reductase flavoprotein subunit